VGYCGGSISEPTYHHLANHAETLQVDFDPAAIGYEEILALFFASHQPTRPSWSSQYRSAIFCDGGRQLEQARQAAAELSGRLGHQVQTEIAPLDRFWWAEGYHQKYLLRQSRPLARELAAAYPRPEDFVQSPVAARVNGFLGGNGSLEQLERELPRYGLSPAAGEELRALAKRRGVSPATCPLAR